MSLTQQLADLWGVIVVESSAASNRLAFGVAMVAAL